MNKDVVYLPVEAVREAVLKFPTPFFLYDEARLRENARRFRATFREFFADFQPLYAVKANPNPEVLKILMDEGFGFDSSSYAEAFLVQSLGARGMHTANYVETEEFAFAKEVGLVLNLDDVSTVAQVAAIGMPELISFRINPGVGKGDGVSNVFAGPDAKYGVPFEKAVEAYRAALAAGAKRFGIHMMTGSNVLSEDYFVLIVGKLLDIVAEIKRETGIEIELMNIGGGFGVPYRPEERSLDLALVARGLRDLMDRKCAEHGIKEPRLFAEPGRYISADCGFLVGKVVSIKDGYKRFVGIDASSSDMPRPSIYDAYHYVSVLNDGELEKVSIVGSICENSDQFARDRMLPRCEVGDVVVIHNCGAHAFAMGSNYNGKLRHAEYLIELNGGLRMIRRAETLDDLFKTLTF